MSWHAKLGATNAFIYCILNGCPVWYWFVVKGLKVVDCGTHSGE